MIENCHWKISDFLKVLISIKKKLAGQTKQNPIRDLKFNKTYANFFGCELLLNEP